jgi:hypothetical protein
MTPMTNNFTNEQRPNSNPLDRAVSIECTYSNGNYEAWSLPNDNWSWDRSEHELQYRGGDVFCYWKEVRITLEEPMSVDMTFVTE